MDRVTKTKHPGRVAQGHKLATLNRERKAALKEQPTQQPTQQLEQQPEQQPTPVSYTHLTLPTIYSV